MKKLTILLPFIILVLFSCKEEQNLSEDILGTWTVVAHSCDSNWVGGTYVFEQDRYTTNLNGNQSTIEYSISNDTLFVHPVAGAIFAQSIVSLNGNSMTHESISGECVVSFER